jgi:hypothetical protein
VLGKGRASPALLSGMRSDLWPFPRHSLRESETRPRREVQCVPTRGVCRRDAGNHKLPSGSGATDPARLADFKEAVEGPQKSARADPRHRNEFPARQCLLHPARLGFGEDTAFRSPNNQRRAGDAAQRPAAIGAGGSGHTSLVRRA